MARPGNPSNEDEFLHALYQGGELLAAGKVIEAKEHLERAYQLQPKNEKGQNLLGLTYFKLGLFDRAAEIYENLVLENPADPTLRVNLGLVYLKTSAVARAIREFETATDLAPDHTRAHNYLGIALAQAGEYGRARDHFLLAGSEQMAEKMSRAIAGEEPAPAAVASPVQAAPMPTRVNGSGHSFAHREPAGQAALSSEANGELQSQDWAAQLTPSPPPQAHGEREIALSSEEIAEGGAIAVPRSAAREAPADDQFDAAFSEPAAEEPPAMEELPAIEQPPAAEELPVDEAVPAPEAVGEIIADAVVETAEPAAEVAPPAEAAPPNFAEAQPAGASQERPRRPLESSRNEEEWVVQSAPSSASAPASASADLPIAALAPKVAMFAGQRPGPFLIEPDAVAIVVQGEILTRVVGLVAQSGQLELEPQNRRYRGRTSDKPFGEGEAQLMRVAGKGRLVVQVPRRTLVSVDLDDESAYFLEEAVFAFEEPVAFENGRVPSAVAPDLDLVHLRGKGRVLLSLPGALRSLAVTEQEPVTVPLTNMVGWHGNLSPKVIALAKDRSGKPTRAGIELSGEGYALLSVGGG